MKAGCEEWHRNSVRLRKSILKWQMKLNTENATGSNSQRKLRANQHHSKWKSVLHSVQSSKLCVTLKKGRSEQQSEHHYTTTMYYLKYCAESWFPKPSLKKCNIRIGIEQILDQKQFRALSQRRGTKGTWKRSKTQKGIKRADGD